MAEEKKEGSGEMFDWLKFWWFFGFWAPAKYKIDFADERIVSVILSILQKMADLWRSKAEAVTQEFMALENPKELLAKRVILRSIKKDYTKAEGKLAEACRVAVKYGFPPVERYQYIWDRAQEKERARRVKKVNA